MSEFSVVICTRHRPLKLERCLTSLREQDHEDHELIVVDNTEGDQDARRVSEEAGARWIVEPAVGLSRARNTGARAASGEIVAYIDDDAMAERTWLTAFSSAFRDRSLAGATGRTFAWPPESPVAQAYEAGGANDSGERPFRIDRETPGWFELSNFGKLGAGMNMAFRRELFDLLPGFHESLGKGTGLLGEENYWLYTLVRSGRAVAYVPSAIVHHEAPPTLSDLRVKQRRKLRAGAAYSLLLLFEERGYRRRVLRYAFSGLRGKRREWRPPVAGSTASRRERAAAALAAPVLYGRWRTRHPRGLRDEA